MSRIHNEKETCKVKSKSCMFWMWFAQLEFQIFSTHTEQKKTHTHRLYINFFVFHVNFDECVYVAYLSEGIYERSVHKALTQSTICIYIVSKMDLNTHLVPTNSHQ